MLARSNYPEITDSSNRGKSIGTVNLFFITKKDFLPNRPGNDMENKSPNKSPDPTLI
jgi:hypothetical protein